MTGITHRVLGAEVGLGVATAGLAIHHLTLAGVPVVLGAMALGMLAAQIPDWDLRLGIPHRGPTHSLFINGVITGVVAIVAHLVLPTVFVLAIVVVGCALASHLLADLTNRTAMALFWPFRRDRVRPVWLPAVLEASMRGHVVEMTAIVAFGSWAVVGVLELMR